MSWYHFSLWVQYCCHPKSAALVCNMQILAKDILLQCSKKLHFLRQFMWLLRWPSILVTIYVLSSIYLQNGVIVYGALSDIMVARCHFAGPIGATIKHQSPGQVLALWIYIYIYIQGYQSLIQILFSDITMEDKLCLSQKICHYSFILYIIIQFLQAFWCVDMKTLSLNYLPVVGQALVFSRFS